MSDTHRRLGAGAIRRFFSILLPVLFLLNHAFAQPLPNLTPDQILQLQQQSQGQRALQDGAPQPNLVLQPDEPLSRQPLPPSRLEQIQSARASAPLRQFGYDQLGRGRSVTVPQTGAVQDDYILGTGDEIVVSLRGQDNNEIRATVDRNGQVSLPRLNPVAAAGRSFGDFRQDVESAIRRAYVATNAFVSIARVRQISVLVSGEVNAPGTRLVTGLSSLVDALLLSGGIKKSGSLRNIRIQRGGREILVDLYSVLTSGGRDARMRLADGDQILVPLLGRTVAISGLVRQPGIYELPARETSISVPSLLQLAGGQEVRGLYRFSVLRIDPDGQSNMVAVSEQTGVVRDSEILFVQLGADQIVNQAVLSGDTGLAGSYPLKDGAKLSEVLRAPGAMGPSPYTLFGLIVRRDRQTLLRTLVPFTPIAIFTGREDIALQSDDMVKVFSLDESRLLDSVIRAYLAAVAQTDIGQDYFSNVSAEKQRQSINSLLNFVPFGILSASGRADRVRSAMETVPGQQNQMLQGQLAPNQLQPNQLAPSSQMQPQQFQQQYQQPYQANQAMPFSPGNPSGQAAVPDRRSTQGANDADLTTETARNFSSSVVRPGSFASNREAENFGQLVRQLNVDPLVLINFLIENRARLEGAVRGPGDYLIGPNTLLENLVTAAGGTVNWADESGVELITTTLDRQTGRSATQRQQLPLRAGTLSNYVLRPRDQLRFAQIYTSVNGGSVSIQGEVRNPGTFSIIRGEHLSDLMARAGGLTTTAYPYGTIFLRQSAARREREGYQRTAREVEDQLVVAMTRTGNSRLDPSTFTSLQFFVQELRDQQGLGRVSVVADPSVLASQPQLDPLLETGDSVYIPQRPSTISVLGQVMQPGNFPYVAGEGVADYLAKAGGYSAAANSSEVYIILPDGSARRTERSWFRFDQTSLPPGSTIVVPRDISPLDLRQVIVDVTQILSQLAVSVASVAVLSKQ